MYPALCAVCTMYSAHPLDAGLASGWYMMKLMGWRKHISGLILVSVYLVYFNKGNSKEITKSNYVDI